MGYVDTGGAWVAGGEPIAATEHVLAVGEAFLAAAATAGRRAVFFATEGQLAELPAVRRMLLGQQPVWNPVEWPVTLAGARSLRAQLRRAHSHGVTVRLVTAAELASEPAAAPSAAPAADSSSSAPMPVRRLNGPDRPSPALPAELRALVRRWQASRAMAEMGFLVRVEPFSAPDERLLFVAERGGTPVALLSMAPVYARGGWLFEDLLRDGTAPNGTSELLVDAGMRHIAALGSEWATLGLAPLAGQMSPWLARVRRWATPFFNFRGLEAFKAKLRPARWEPIWMVHPGSIHPLRALVDSLTAFADGSLLRFGWKTLLRGPRPVLVAMAVLLVPWTLVLALLEPTRWYPAPWMQTAWVTFDVLLCVAIASLAWRWRDAWAVAVALAVTLDALLSSWLAVSWYLPRAQRWTDVLWTVVACSAPALAAVVLWGGVRRRRMASDR